MTDPSPVADAVVLFGDRAALVHCGSIERMWTLDAQVRASGALDGLVRECVPGWGTLVVHARAGVDPRRLVAPLRSLVASDATASIPIADPAVHVIPVVYDGPDLEEVARRTGLTIDDVVRVHAAGAYRVAFVGFSPGFPYLSGLDDRLSLPRRDTPRPRVPAGSVAIGGGQAGIYPSSAPGGWHLLGRTDARLFDPRVPDPARLHAGDRVQFRAVDRLGGPTVEVGSPSATDDAPAPPDAIAAARVREGGALVQCVPRDGLARSGVPAAGPADPWSASVARRLLGVSHDAPLLEVGPLGIAFEVVAPIVVVVPRGAGTLEIDGRTAAYGAPVRVDAGSVVRVRVAGRRSGVLGVRGLWAPGAFGGSTDVLAGLGPSPLGPGDQLVVRSVDAAVGSRVQRVTAPVDDERMLPLRCVVGPHASADDPTLRALLAREWTVSSPSNRVGTRLDGARLPLPSVGSLPSCGMVPGAVQVPPDGMPVVLGPDHGTTGGYPVVAVVIDADSSRAAVLPAGAPMRFRLVTMDEAVLVNDDRARSLATAVADLELL